MNLLEKVKESHISNVVYYDMSKAVILLYDVCNVSSFEDTEKWRKSIVNLAQIIPELYLIGNKIDDSKKRLVSKHLGAQLAKKNNMHFSEISAKNGIGTKELLDRILGSTKSYKRTNELDNEEDAFLVAPKKCLDCYLI